MNVNPTRVLPVLFFGVLMAALDIAIVAPALPALQEHFGVDERAASWIINAFVVFNLVGLSLMTRLSDLYGRRLIYIIDVLMFAVGSIIVATSTSFAVLIVGRCVQGVAASGIFPVASAVVGDVYPREKRGRALGILGAVFGLAFLIGPILGGILLQFGWPLLFLVNIPLAILVAALAFMVLPSDVERTDRRLDIAGMVFLGAMLAALAFGLNGIRTDALIASFLSVRVWPFLAAACGLVYLFVQAEKRASDPLMRLGLMQNPQVRLAALFAVGAGLSEAAFLFLSGFAGSALEVSKSEASFMLIPLVLGVMFGSPVAGRMLDRTGSRSIVFAGTTISTIGMLILGLVEPTKTTFYLGSTLVGVGLSGLLGSSISYILLNEAQVQERTVAQGISTMFISIGQLVGSALIGATVASSLSRVAGYQASFVGLAIAGAILALSSLRLKKRAEEWASEPAR